MEEQVTHELSYAAHRAAGLKQVLKAIQAGRAVKVFMALDAQEHLQEQLMQAAQAHGVPLETVPTMKELGRLSGIQVPSAAAAVLSG